VVYPRGRVAPALLATLRAGCPAAQLEGLAPRAHFPGAVEALRQLASAKYFSAPLRELAGLRDLLAENDPLGLTPRPDAALAVAALGAIVS